MNEGRVYFIRPVGMNGPVKIGHSVVPESRLDVLSVWSPLPLHLIGSVPGTYADEQFLHRAFVATHSHREWFFYSAELGETISLILEAGSVDAARHTLVIPEGAKRPSRRNPWNDMRRERVSYASRIRNAQRRLRKGLSENDAWDVPGDVQAILDRWESPSRYRPNRVAQRPTEAEFAILNRYLADPKAHSVVPSWVRKIAA